MAGANAVPVGIPKDDIWDRIHNLSRAVALFAFPRCAVDLYQLGEVNPAGQERFHGLDVGFESFAGELVALAGGGNGQLLGHYRGQESGVTKT